jgi:hypothetical protein
MLFLICCWNRFVTILLRILASKFIKESGIWFSFLLCPSLVLGKV